MLNPQKKPRKSESPTITAAACVCLTALMGVTLCVYILYIYIDIFRYVFCVFLSSNVFRSLVKCCQSCSQTFSVRAEELPRQPLARCTRGHIRDGMLDLFYTRVCAMRCWVCIKACCSSLCVCIRTHLSDLFLVVARLAVISRRKCRPQWNPVRRFLTSSSSSALYFEWLLISLALSFHLGG